MANDSIPDENGADSYYEDWLAACKMRTDLASNGERVTTALALRIAADVLRCRDPEVPDTPEQPGWDTWTLNDMRLARAAIAGLRAQGGCEGLDPAVRDGKLTHFCDIIIYG